MDNDEVQLLPSSLVTCLLNDEEVKIINISPFEISIRKAEPLKGVESMVAAFYVFDKYEYKEVNIEEFKLIEEKQKEFYNTYTFEINHKEFKDNVIRISNDYSKYANLRAFGDGNDFSKEMVGYPAEKDYDFTELYTEQKREWMKDFRVFNHSKKIINNIELGIKIDNDTLYERYLNNDIDTFKEEYYRENYLSNQGIFSNDISRIYIGNEFCHNLFPSDDILIRILDKAFKEGLNITICFTYMRDCYIEKIKNIIDMLYVWCGEHKKNIEAVINDWGMIELFRKDNKYISLNLGVLLNKRKKDPRYIYKKGYKENQELMSMNSLNNSNFVEFMNENNIKRYEYENCGYDIKIPQGSHSLHLPFYVTNTSQYCTLYAMCTNLDRGKQKLVTECPKFCRDYVFSYPEHLKMVGRYNSLFSFDDTLLKDESKLEYYINNNIDRIILNFI